MCVSPHLSHIVVVKRQSTYELTCYIWFIGVHVSVRSDQRASKTFTRMTVDFLKGTTSDPKAWPKSVVKTQYIYCVRFVNAKDASMVAQLEVQEAFSRLSSRESCSSIFQICSAFLVGLRFCTFRYPPRKQQSFSFLLLKESIVIPSSFIKSR